MLEVPDGNYNAAAISRALEHAQDFTGKPVFLNIKTIIGLGTSKADTCYAHEDPFGPEDIAKCKEIWDLDPTKFHQVPEEVRRYWSKVPEQCMHHRCAWEQQLSQYEHKYPALAKSLMNKIKGDFGTFWKEPLLKHRPPHNEKISTLQASANIHDSLWPTLPTFSGSADLLACSGITNLEGQVFGARAIKGQIVDFAGRYIHYGIREHGMMAVANGIAAYSKRAFLPVTSTLAAFHLYGAAALRMSAICGLQVVHIGTHDSIEAAVLGPTHQVSTVPS